MYLKVPLVIEFSGCHKVQNDLENASVVASHTGNKPVWLLCVNGSSLQLFVPIEKLEYTSVHHEKHRCLSSFFL